MLSPLRHAPYRRLFAAQVSALLGTGLATVALGLLAHELARAGAGEILGVALAIKMMAYVVVAPFASALAAHLPRKALLIGLDVVRAAVAASLPFVGEAWQVYALMTVLFVAAAAFTPTFQAILPDVLPDERDYTKALSLSRLAADLESVASPLLAALLLAVLSWSQLFAGTALGFMVSAGLVLAAALPASTAPAARPFAERLVAGLRLFALTPRLRGLFAFSLATAAGGAMVFVNTVILVQSRFGLSPQATAWALAAFGAGSMAAAVAVPKLLDRLDDRRAIGLGAMLMTATLLVGSIAATRYAALLGLWVVMGVGYALTITPAGRTLRRSSNAADRPALFAAQFALSHASWLIAYPLAGFASALLGLSAAYLVLAILCGVGGLAGFHLWPRRDPERVAHAHPDLAPDNPHLSDHRAHDAAHAHPYVIDTLHRRWPS